MARAELLLIALLAFASCAGLAYVVLRPPRRRASVPAMPTMAVPVDALLPADLPAVDGVQISASYVPGDGEGGGGDFFDAFFLDDETLALAVGEAGGSGVRALATMNVVRQAIRNAFLDGARPADVLRRANRALVHSDHPALVTALVGVLDPATLQLRYACAGHAPPLLAGDDEWSALPGAGSGVPLGTSPNHVTSEHRVTLPVDGLLALYTDGCVELDGDATAGTRALGEALIAARNLAPNRPASAIDRAIFGMRPRADDATILTIAPQPTLAHLNLRVGAERASGPLARNALRRFLAATPLDERRTYDALVAAGEAISNAIEHAYEGRPNQALTIRGRYEDGACTIVIEDQGTWKPESELPGRGIPMMKSLSDECTIEHDRRGTRVTLRFALAASVADAALQSTSG